MIKEYFNFALINVKHRALRSWLTIVGIIIGVAAIMALIMVSLGLQTAIEDQFEMFGPNRILISPQGFQGPGTASQGFTQRDVETIDNLGSFEYVIPTIAQTAQIEFNDETKFASVVGFPGEDFEKAFSDVDMDLETGRMFKRGEKYVAVLGIRAADSMFEKEIRVRNTVEINGEDFKVIGIFEEIGNSADDNQINIPLESARDVFDAPDRVDFIMAQAKAGADIPFLQEKIERALERERGDENFQVLTATQILDQINVILGVVQVVLIGIAAISLLVGGIGILNSMYTSVLERTKEIGIMKSVGATRQDIMFIFLIESGLVGLIGGVVGVLLGMGIAFLVGFIASQSGFSLLKIEVNFFLIAFGLLFAVIVGMASGTLPAIRASKLNAVDALRYE